MVRDVDGSPEVDAYATGANAAAGYRGHDAYAFVESRLVPGEAIRPLKPVRVVSG